MVVYSFYIFDRHTECIYRKTWLPHPNTTTTTTVSNPGSSSVSISSSSTTTAATIPTSTTTNDPSTSSTPPSSQQQQPPPTSSSSKSRFNGTSGTNKTSAQKQQQQQDDTTKLIFGTIFSLRNIVRKLGGPEDNFISYRTPSYKLHYYETPTNLKFVMMTDSKTQANLRIVLHQIYVNLYVEYVVKNPLAPVEHKGGRGVMNSELFELGVERFISAGLV